jgi:hypothetical protein
VGSNQGSVISGTEPRLELLMAGHWIEWEKGLVRKPEVLRIAHRLGCTPQHAAACCMMVWEWAEDVTENGMIPGVTAADVSFAAGVEGIGEAMLAVGWLLETDDSLVLPNWDRHNTEPSKRRALKALYMRVYRAEKKSRGLKKRAGSVPGA